MPIPFRRWTDLTLLVSLTLTLTACPENDGVVPSASVTAGAWGTAALIEPDNASHALAVWAQSDGTRRNIWANRYE